MSPGMSPKLHAGPAEIMAVAVMQIIHTAIKFKRDSWSRIAEN